MVEGPDIVVEITEGKGHWVPLVMVKQLTAVTAGCGMAGRVINCHHWVCVIRGTGIANTFMTAGIDWYIATYRVRPRK